MTAAAGVQHAPSASSAATFTEQPGWGSWWDESWICRARVFIDNHLGDRLLTEFPIPIYVPYRDGMRPDFADIRFTDMEGRKALPYWLEEVVPSSHATAWVRVPEIPAATNVYLYFGNPDASSESDTRGYAELWEDFAADPLRGSGWTVYRHSGQGGLEGYWDPQGGHLYLTRPERDLGAAIFTDIDLRTLDGWLLTFDYLVGGGTGAEGFCAMFYKDEAPYSSGRPSSGNGLGFTEAEGGAISGYGVEFDARGGEGDPAMQHVALIKDRADNHLVTVGEGRVADGLWHNVELLHYRNQITLSLDQGVLFSHNLTSSGGDRDYGGLGFSGATGEHTNDHLIDNVTLRKWTEPMPSSLVGDTEGLYQTVVETSFGEIKALYR